MKKILIPVLVCFLVSCLSKKESTFQAQMLAMGKEYASYRAAHPDFDTYSAQHEKVIWDGRRLACQKKYDTITATIKDIIEFGEGSYEIACQSQGSIFYRTRIRFKDSIDIKQSPFYKYKQSLDKGDVVRIPMMLYEVSGLGPDNGAWEIYFWPIPEGVTDIKAQLQKDLWNTWHGPAEQFDTDDCNSKKI